MKKPLAENHWFEDLKNSTVRYPWIALLSSFGIGLVLARSDREKKGEMLIGRIGDRMLTSAEHNFVNSAQKQDGIIFQILLAGIDGLRDEVTRLAVRDSSPHKVDKKRISESN